VKFPCIWTTSKIFDIFEEEFAGCPSEALKLALTPQHQNAIFSSFLFYIYYSSLLIWKKEKKISN